MSNKNILHFVKILALVVLLLMTAISYHPAFSSIVTDQGQDNPLNRYIYALTVLVFALHFDLRAWKNSVFIRFFSIQLIFVALLGGLSVAFNVSSEYLTETKSLLMSLVFIIIGYNSRINRKEIHLVIIFYAVAVMFSTYSQIMNNFGGFVIADQYMQYGKNTLGVMTASSFFSLLMIAFYPLKRFERYLGLFLAFFILFLVITIRARAAYLTTFILLFYCIYKYLKQKGHERKGKEVTLLVGGTILLCVIGVLMFTDISVIWDYVFNSFTQNQGSDLSSSRIERDRIALTIIAENPFFGNLVCNKDIPLVHNYALRVLSSYGILGSMPLIILYGFLIYYVLRRIFHRAFCFNVLGYLTVLILLIISVAEPTFPYAPGTGVILPFVLFGSSDYSNSKYL